MRRRQFVGALAASATLPVVGARPGTATQSTSLSPESVTPVPGAAEVGVGEDGTTVYAAAHDALVVMDYADPSNPTEQARLVMSIEGQRLSGIQDVSVAGDRALVAGPPGRTQHDEASGAALVDVSDPANPEQVAEFPRSHAVHNVYLDGNTAYMTGTGLYGAPVLVFDVSDDGTEQVADWRVFEALPGWEEVSDSSFYSCHDIYVQDDRAYVAYWDAGTLLLDVSDPADPHAVAKVGGIDPTSIRDPAPFEALELPGNSHYARPAPDGDLLAVGREAFDFSESDDHDEYDAPGGIALFDLTGETPAYVTSLKPPTVETAEGDPNTSTAHNFGFRGRTLYTSWYTSGIHVYDVSDPASPLKLGEWSNPGETSFWTARALEEGFVASSTIDPSASDVANDERQQATVYAFPEPDTDGEPAETFTTMYGEPVDERTKSTVETLPRSADQTTRNQATTESSTAATTATTQGPTTDATTTSATTTDASSGVAPGFGLVVGAAGAALAALHRLRED